MEYEEFATSHFLISVTHTLMLLLKTVPPDPTAGILTHTSLRVPWLPPLSLPAGLLGHSYFHTALYLGFHSMHAFVAGL